MHLSGDHSYEYLVHGLHSGEHLYNLRRALERFERGYLHNILMLYDCDIGHTAEMLDISPEELRAKMRQYELLKSGDY